jgi:hypothetical protein
MLIDNQAFETSADPGHSVALSPRVHQASVQKYLAALILALIASPLQASVPVADKFSATTSEGMEVELLDQVADWLGRLTYHGVTRHMSKRSCPTPLIPALYQSSPKVKPSTKWNLSLYTSDGIVVSSTLSEFRNFYCSFEHPYEGLLISCSSLSCWAWLPRR